MPDEPILRQQAREAVLKGKLPARRPDRVWGGPGVGEICAICDKRITKEDIEYQLEFARPAEDGIDKYHVHLRCNAAWEFERRAAGEALRGSGSGS
jgi:hypothetical protein